MILQYHLNHFLKKLEGEKTSAILTSFQDLNKIIEGFKPGNLYLVCARESVGKTALFSYWANHILLQQKRKVILFLPAMSSELFVQRQLSQFSGVQVENIVAGRLTANELVHLQKAAQKLNGVSLFIDDSPFWTLDMLEEKLADDVTRLMPAVVFIDSIEFVFPMQTQISRKLARLRSLARDLSVPIVVSTQLKAKSKSVVDLSVIKKNGIKLKHVDVLIAMYRPDYFVARRGETFLNVLQNSGGPTGAAKIIARLEVQQFFSD